MQSSDADRIKQTSSSSSSKTFENSAGEMGWIPTTTEVSAEEWKNDGSSNSDGRRLHISGDTTVLPLVSWRGVAEGSQSSIVNNNGSKK